MNHTSKTKRAGRARGVARVSLARLTPAPENSDVYRPVRDDDPEIVALAESIKKHGMKEPLVITRDYFIISGHRRFAAARLAGLKTVPCRIEPFRRADDPERFLRLLAECNRQRVKSFDEKLREAVIEADPEDAYTALLDHREEQTRLDVKPIQLRERRRRCEISAAKRPFLEAIKRVLDDRRDYWPMSVRQIHYALLNAPPLTHASKRNSTYRNDQASYRKLVELSARARLAYEIPMEAIADDTRPVVTWEVYRDVGAFLRGQIDGFLKGYWRDLMQSQPCHIEIIGEKNTILPIIQPVAADYCIPLTIGRGYASLPPRAAIVERYENSGKDRLVLLVLSDFDPEGEDIPESFARSLRDDFGVSDVVPIKVALTAEQVAEYDLPPILEAKKKSSRYKRFAAAHGDVVHELEALSPNVLQTILREAIEQVVDRRALNREIEREKADAARLAGIRRMVCEMLKTVDLSDGEGV
jgi:ParB-like chromosome segregation protein Spo0J